MSYRFEDHETPGDAVGRIAAEQLTQALQLTKAKGKLDDAVHDVRVCFKKMRGLLRLVRQELGDEQYQRENTFYRDLNRRLSEVRDSAALVEALGKLEERFADELSGNAFTSVRRSLARATRKRQSEKEKVLGQVRKQILKARKRVRRWSIKNDKFSAVGLGLVHIYEQGQSWYARAYAKQRARDFHEWRKQTKYFWYQVSLLRKLWPKELKRFAAQIEKLVDYLSDDHDLSILRNRVLNDAKSATHGHEHEAITALIDKRRAELQTQARFLGERIYAEKPRAFQKRFHEYWQAWRREQQTNPLAA